MDENSIFFATSEQDMEFLRKSIIHFDKEYNEDWAILDPTFHFDSLTTRTSWSSANPHGYLRYRSLDEEQLVYTTLGSLFVEIRTYHHRVELLP